MLEVARKCEQRRNKRARERASVAPSWRTRTCAATGTVMHSNNASAKCSKRAAQTAGGAFCQHSMALWKSHQAPSASGRASPNFFFGAGGKPFHSALCAMPSQTCFPLSSSLKVTSYLSIFLAQEKIKTGPDRNFRPVPEGRTATVPHLTTACTMQVALSFFFFFSPFFFRFFFFFFFFFFCTNPELRGLVSLFLQLSSSWRVLGCVGQLPAAVFLGRALGQQRLNGSMDGLRDRVGHAFLCRGACFQREWDPWSSRTKKSRFSFSCAKNNSRIPLRSHNTSPTSDTTMREGLF